MSLCQIIVYCIKTINCDTDRLKSRFSLTPVSGMDNLSFRYKVNNMTLQMYKCYNYSDSVTIDNLNEILYSAENNSSSNINGYSFEEVYTNWIEMIKNEMYTYTVKISCNLRVSISFGHQFYQTCENKELRRSFEIPMCTFEDGHLTNYLRIRLILSLFS